MEGEGLLSLKRLPSKVKSTRQKWLASGKESKMKIYNKKQNMQNRLACMGRGARDEGAASVGKRCESNVATFLLKFFLARAKDKAK